MKGNYGLKPWHNINGLNGQINNVPWNKGKKLGIIPKSAWKKGHTPINKGKPMDKKQKIKISLHHTGEKVFTGFKKEFKFRLRSMGKYLEWRSEIFKRDNYHCQFCGKKGYLEAHHIIPFSIILKEFNIKNTEESLKCKELWDIGNGISYCKKCHDLLKNKGGVLKLRSDM